MPNATWEPDTYVLYYRFNNQITEKLKREEKIGRLYTTNNHSNVLMMFIQAKKGINKARFLLDCRFRNKGIIKKKTIMINIDQLLV